MFSRREYLVYAYNGSRPCLTSEPYGLGLEQLTLSNVSELFDSNRGKVFGSFLRKGYVGLALRQGPQWVAYGWMTTPLRGHPPHLPLKVTGGAYWIFFCRTHEAWRGRGCYKFILKALTARAFDMQTQGPVHIHIDTSAANVPSRIAISDAGFKPAGTVVAHGVDLLGFRLECKVIWAKDRGHCPMLEGPK